MADPMLQVREAEVRFGELRAVRAVDLDLAAGERLALLGPRGAGSRRCCVRSPGLNPWPPVRSVSTANRSITYRPSADRSG